MVHPYISNVEYYQRDYKTQYMTVFAGIKDTKRPF